MNWTRGTPFALPRNSSFTAPGIVTAKPLRYAFCRANLDSYIRAVPAKAGRPRDGGFATFAGMTGRKQ